MPGNIGIIDRHKRLVAIKEQKDEGKTTKEIAKELSMPIATVERNLNYLKELSVSDLTPEEVGEKRGELYLELVQATEEAKDAYDDVISNEKHTDARRHFKSWMEAITLRMKLYGLDMQKAGPVNVINNQTNYIEPEKIDVDAGRRIADILKRNHESSRT